MHRRYTIAILAVVTVIAVYLAVAELSASSGGSSGGGDPSPPVPGLPDLPRYLASVQNTAASAAAVTDQWRRTANSLVTLLPQGDQLRDASQHVASLPAGVTGAAVAAATDLANALDVFAGATRQFSAVVAGWDTSTPIATMMSAKPQADALPVDVLGLSDRFANAAPAFLSLHDSWVSQYAGTVVRDGCSGLNCPPCSNGMKCVGAKAIFDATTGTTTCINGDCHPVMNDSMKSFLQTVAQASAAAGVEASASGSIPAAAGVAQRAYASLFSYLTGL